MGWVQNVLRYGIPWDRGNWRRSLLVEMAFVLVLFAKNGMLVLYFLYIKRIGGRGNGEGGGIDKMGWYRLVGGEAGENR